MTIPTEALYGQQWHFATITNNGTDPSLMERLWDEYSGAGVHVGVYDSGVEYTHTDLDGNYDPTRHVLIDTDSDPMTPAEVHDGVVVGDNGHGTCVAGIIGAEMNGEGTVGIASGASLTSVNILGAGSAVNINTALAGFLEAVHQMTNFEVTNNSWGNSSSFLASENPNVAGSFTELLLAEYTFVAANGRGGLGTVICKSAGNNNVDASGEGIDTSRFTLTVGAILENGFAASYSNYGASLLVSSAGGDTFSSFTTNDVSTVDGTRLITTTDQVGANGLNNVTPEPNSGTPPFSLQATDFTNRMNGTSAATPMVTGIVALMFEANPDLGWRDVHNILAATAFQTGSGVGNAPGLNEGSAWFVNEADGWNGGGMHFSNDYGYGSADAFGAVRLAEAFGIMDATAQTSANEQTTTTGTVASGAAIADMTDNSYSFSIAGNLSIEHVDITIDLTHSFFTNLRMFLVSAQGTEVQLYDGLSGTDATADAGITWTFGIEALRGELSAGTWTLKINDVVSGDAGTLNDVKIDVFGSTPNNNDTYHFTREFDHFASLDPSRLILTDSDGGTDWFDGSTLLAAAALNLNDGAASSIDAQTLTIAAGTFIEHAILSDGNDVILGNELGNRLHGMRGNDTLQGGTGADTIAGGAGTDYLYGASVVSPDPADAADVLRGGDGNDVLQGNGGGDETHGDAGLDTVGGGAGSDSVFGEAGDDVLAGGEGNDFLQGNDGNDSQNGNGGQDTVGGGKDNDTLFGGAGNDVLAGGNGNDSVYGGSTTSDPAIEADTLSGGEGNDFVQGNGGNDQVNGDAGIDTVGGGAGNDSLNGGADNDQMSGGAGADTLRGGSGNDSLTGGGVDNDLFVFFDGDGADTVGDFADNGLEKFDLSGLVTGAQNFGELVVTDTAGPGVTVNYGTGTFLVFNINNTAQIDAGDFLF